MVRRSQPAHSTPHRANTVTTESIWVPFVQALPVRPEARVLAGFPASEFELLIHFSPTARSLSTLLVESRVVRCDSA